MEIINYKTKIQELCQRICSETPFCASVSFHFNKISEAIGVFISDADTSKSIYSKTLYLHPELYNEDRFKEAVRDLENIINNNQIEDYGKHI